MVKISLTISLPYRPDEAELGRIKDKLTKGWRRCFEHRPPGHERNRGGSRDKNKGADGKRKRNSKKKHKKNETQCSPLDYGTNTRYCPQPYDQFCPHGYHFTFPHSEARAGATWEDFNQFVPDNTKVYFDDNLRVLVVEDDAFDDDDVFMSADALDSSQGVFCINFRTYDFYFGMEGDPLEQKEFAARYGWLCRLIRTSFGSSVEVDKRKCTLTASTDFFWLLWCNPFLDRNNNNNNKKRNIKALPIGSLFIRHVEEDGLDLQFMRCALRLAVSLHLEHCNIDVPHFELPFKEEGCFTKTLGFKKCNFERSRFLQKLPRFSSITRLRIDLRHNDDILPTPRMHNVIDSICRHEELAKIELYFLCDRAAWLPGLLKLIQTKHLRSVKYVARVEFEVQSSSDDDSMGGDMRRDAGGDAGGDTNRNDNDSENDEYDFDYDGDDDEYDAVSASLFEAVRKSSHLDDLKLTEFDGDEDIIVTSRIFDMMDGETVFHEILPFVESRLKLKQFKARWSQMVHQHDAATIKSLIPEVCHRKGKHNASLIFETVLITSGHMQWL
mmetsp:Transcript_23047/g.64221  ORF Transcript_23047/g.64221 Transcript_23047/m.64221 type:complete len:555 (-) Transcript_23047:1311-2975(-)|eukprot:CAMPEP_0198119602 /NCGR_PEP_ID=MMETSP1442-20131203/26276_1 /TAXON_ID= /ORGANISM="Craspedostauros australis, Strain CCMP3328" /LENGTH=554 /DNA_ID=CAMNT_0043778109 /DNA_START=177 /DNA_END=1841 /DNA_ORIENTATION=-